MDDSTWCGNHWPATETQHACCEVHTDAQLHEFHSSELLRKFGVDAVFYCPVERCTYVVVQGYPRAGMFDQVFLSAVQSMHPRNFPMERLFEALLKEMRDSAVCLAVMLRKIKIRECAET